MIVLDASVIIAYLDAKNVHHERAEAMLAREIDDEFAVNSLTLAEVLAVPGRGHRLDAARAALHDLEVHELPFPADAALKLAQLRASTGLKMPDCCVLLAAEDVDSRIASFDERLNQAATERGRHVVNR